MNLSRKVERLYKAGLRKWFGFGFVYTPPAAPRSSPQVRLTHCRYPNHKAADAIMPLYYVKTLISRLGAARSAGGCHRESQRAGGAR